MTSLRRTLVSAVSPGRQSEQTSFAQRSICAIRAKRRASFDAIAARSDRIRLNLTPLLVALMLVPFASAQRMGGMHFSRGPGSYGAHFSHREYGGAYYPFFDPLYGDYFSGTEYGSPQPQVIVLQSRQPAPAPETAPVPSQPLMIELQGDRYVQVSGDQPSRSQMIESSAPLISRPNAPAQSSAIPNAVLIFRDGHRQDVSSYTIAGGTLFAASDFATTGSWTQKIALSALNVPETIAANSSAGHPFHLPSFPNEVIIGP